MLRRLLLAILLLYALPSFAQREDWLPVTQQELRLNTVPGISGAPAIQLYYADYIDDQEQTEFFYRRIKVLNDRGMSYADVEIPVPPDCSVAALKARTIHPDGAVVEFTGKPFRKLLLKQRGLKVMALTFTMPDVSVNSIIEYKYKINLPGIYLDNSWTIQHELYTVKESFRMKPFRGPLEGFEKGHQVAALTSRMPGNLKPRQKGDGYELELENMPPFDSEGYMPPEEDYKPQVRFFYGGKEISSTENFWQDAGREWNADAERFIGRHREINDEAERVIGSETDPLKKLRKLYARAQEIRNLSYERERTEQEEKKENLKPNQTAADVLAHGYGDREDVGRLFVALARAAGFDASVLRVSDRQEKFFDRGLLSRRQLGTEIALVTESGQNYFLDPGTRFCPFGFVRWMNTSTLALKLDKNGGTFIKIPAAGYDKAMIRRAAEMTLDRAGSLKGTLTVRFEGGEALERRLAALATDEAGRNADLEKEAQGWLPSGATIKLTSAEGWQGSEEALIATFSVELPSYAVTAGKRLLAPAYLFQSKELEAFQHAERKYPVYFPYAFGEADTVSIKVPAGQTIESVPPQQSNNLSYASYLNATEFDGTQLLTHRVLQLNGIFFRVETYPQVRDFFLKVQSGDEQRAVLRSDGAPVTSTNR
jgi:Domain of Unknown Function with PDB structure (DUF3857)/Transglutaminase-like superfamily